MKGVTLKESEKKILLELRDKESRYKDLKKATKLSSPVLTEVLRDLRSNGYIETRKSPKDGRVKIHTITKKGKQKLKDYWKNQLKEAQSALEDFD